MQILNRYLPALISVIGFQGLAYAQGHVDFWDRPPIGYSDANATDRLGDLASGLSTGRLAVPPGDGLSRLRYVLKALDVPEESQVLAYSKTSLQNDLINPANPRAIYFSENAYVAYVPGGDIEAVIQDPVLGPVFYFVGTDRAGGLTIERDTSRCLSCHATARTENVPGMLIRSVFPDQHGNPLLHLGTTDVTDMTPIAERWGGWYVTGRSALPHMGNRTFNGDGSAMAHIVEHEDLLGEIDISRYLRPTSDVVALLVLEHQCRIHTLLNAASLNYRRSRHFSAIIDPDSDPDKGSAGKVAESWAEKITDCIFFKDEADLGDGVEGDPAFQTAFIQRFPKTAKNQSLADFRLYGRIFKRQCSYMVYSDAFSNLPATLKSLVLAKMHRAIAGKDGRIGRLADPERKRIGDILSETLPGWNEVADVPE